MTAFEWDAGNERHVARHGIKPYEAEQAATDLLALNRKVYDTPTERRQAMVGATIAGRLLFVVITQRGEKTRVVMARPTKRSERVGYEAQNTW